MSKTKYHTVKSFVIYTFYRSVESDDYNDIFELKKLEKYREFDTEQAAIDHINELEDFVDYTILPVYSREILWGDNW